LYIACRTAKLDDSYGDASDDPIDQWFLEEMGKPESSVCFAFRLLNFCRVHSTLKITPAMAAGLTDHRWSIGELIMAGA
jgi:hypothetical protein